MKRKKKFNLKRSINNTLNLFSRTQRYYFIVLFLFIFIDYFMMQSRLIDSFSATNTVGAINNLFGLLYGIAILIVSYFISQFDFKRTFFIKLIVSYIIYISLSFLIDVTTNINNPQYKIWDFKNNELFQLYSLGNFLAILLISSIFYFIRKYYDKKAHRRLMNAKIHCSFEYLILGQFLVTFIFTDSKFPGFISRTASFMQLLDEYHIGKYSEVLYWSVLPTFLLLFFILSLFSFLFLKGQTDLVKNKATFSLSIFLSSVFSIIFNFTLQIGMGYSEKFLGYSFLPGALLFQCLTFFILFQTLYLIINRIVFSTYLIVLFIVSISIGNAIKFSMRNEPVLLTDISWLGSIDQLFGFIDFSIVIYSFIALLILSLLFIISRKILLRGRIVRNYGLRFTSLLGIAFLTTNVFYAFNHKEQNGQISDGIPVVSQLNNFQNIVWMGNTVNARYKTISYVWFNQLANDVIPVPENYSKNKMKEIEKKYSSIATDLNQTRDSNIQDHTVIYILSESFSDPGRIDTVELNRDVIPNIRAIKDKVTSGLMQSDGFGGGTANMEFQTLFGLPYYNMSQSVSVLYTEVFPRMKIKPSISNSFNSKNRIAFHFNDEKNYSRDIVYSELKFNRFITSPAKGIDEEKQGVYLSDKTLYDTVLKNISNNSNDNQFFSVITMQNHAPWSESSPEDLKAEGVNFSKEENEKLLNFSKLLTHTDVATQDFLEKLSKIDKKITVVFYGDHLPGLYPESAFKNYPEGQYQTDYFIWSNFDAPKLDYPLVNSSDFSAMVFEQTNSKVSPYYALLTEVLKKASVDKKALEGEAQEIAEDLKMVEYDLISGKGYLSKDFFEVPSAKKK